VGDSLHPLLSGEKEEREHDGAAELSVSEEKAMSPVTSPGQTSSLRAVMGLKFHSCFWCVWNKTCSLSFSPCPCASFMSS
jgi:hypothetical protein